MKHLTALLRGLASLAAGLVVASGSLGAAESEDPDWPCVQILVPEVSAAAMWAGPPLEELSAEERSDAEVVALARRIAARRTTMEEATQAIETYAAGLGDLKNRRLTALFAASLDAVNRERGEIMSGIRRYSRRQQALAQRIEQATAAHDSLTVQDSEAQAAQRRQLEEQLVWDARIFEERERSLTYICEQPVILEQRIFALAREIMMRLD